MKAIGQGGFSSSEKLLKVIALASLLMLLMGIANAQAGPSPKNSDATPEEREAQTHYRVALVALKNNDLAIALDELQKAAQLAPRNALIFYNLAIVLSKKDELQSAQNNLQAAILMGLPNALDSEVADFSADLAYKIRKKDALSYFVGTWLSGEHCSALGLKQGSSSDARYVEGDTKCVWRTYRIRIFQTADGDFGANIRLTICAGPTWSGCPSYYINDNNNQIRKLVKVDADHFRFEDEAAQRVYSGAGSFTRQK